MYKGVHGRYSATSSSLEVKRMDISDVARRSGIPASTLRFYEEKGLIASTGRHGLKRVFKPDVLERLALIKLASASGFSLNEIRRMFAPDGRVRIERAMLAAKADELEKTIRRLNALRDGLRHAAACPAPSHMECPTFRRLLGLASKSAAPTRRSATSTPRSPSRTPPRRRARAP